MSEYIYKFDAGSPHQKMLEYLLKNGVEEKDIDTGFYQVDYYKPGERGYVEGAGDKVLDPREIEEFSINNWKKFSAPFKESFATKIPWDYRENWKEAPDRVDDIKKIALKTGAKEGTDEYRSTLAKMLFAYLNFPNAKAWEVLENSQQNNILTRLGLNDPSMAKLKKYLISDGGVGIIEVNYPKAKDSSFNLNIQFRATGFVNELYYLFDLAGLNPTYLDLTGIGADKFDCSEEINDDAGVGIELSTGWLKFDPIDHRLSPDGEIFYPISLRQSITYYGVLFDVYKTIISKGDVMPMEDVASADGFPSLMRFLMGLGSLVKTENEEAAKEQKSSLLNNMVDNKKFHHPFMFLLLKMFAENDPKLQEKISILAMNNPIAKEPGIMAKLLLLAYKDTKDAIPPEKVIAALETMKATDPNCKSLGYLEAALADDGLISLPEEEVEKKLLETAENTSILPDFRSKAYLDLAILELKRAALDAALDHVQLALEKDDKKTAFHTNKLAIMLSMILYRRGDKDEALDVITKQIQTIMKDENFLGDDDIEDLYIWASNRRHDGAFPKIEDMSPEMRGAFVGLHIPIAQNLMAAGDYEMAADAVNECLAGSTKEDGFMIKMILHETYMRRGMMKEAEAIWPTLSEKKQGE